MDVDKQIYSIKQKEAMTNTYKTNISTQVHLSLGHKCQKSTFSDINDRLCEWLNGI